MFRDFFDSLKKMCALAYDKVIESTLSLLFDGIIDIYGDPETRLWADDLMLFPEIWEFIINIIDIIIALTRLLAAILRYYGFFRHIELNDLTFNILYYVIMTLSIFFYYFGYVLANDTLLETEDLSFFKKKLDDDKI